MPGLGLGYIYRLSVPPSAVLVSLRAGSRKMHKSPPSGNSKRKTLYTSELITSKWPHEQGERVDEEKLGVRVRRYKHCSYCLGRRYFVGVWDFCSKIHILCIQPIYRSIRRVFSTLDNIHVDMIASTRKGKTSMAALVLFGDSYEAVERNASQSTRIMSRALGEPS